MGTKEKSTYEERAGARNGGRKHPIGGAKEVSWYFSGARERQAPSEKWRVQCRLIFSFIYASVTEWQREDELQVGRAFSGDTAACFRHYPLDKGVVVEAP